MGVGEYELLSNDSAAFASLGAGSTWGWIPYSQPHCLVRHRVTEIKQVGCTENIMMVTFLTKTMVLKVERLLFQVVKGIY